MNIKYGKKPLPKTAFSSMLPQQEDPVTDGAQSGTKIVAQLQEQQQRALSAEPEEQIVHEGGIIAGPVKKIQDYELPRRAPTKDEQHANTT